VDSPHKAVVVAARVAPGVALLFAAVLALVSCSATSTPNSRHSHTHQASESRSVPTVAGVVLLPVIRPGRRACNRLAQTKSVLVLCPTILPRPATTHPATPIGVHTFPFCHALVRPAGCPLYDLAVMYGAPDEPPNGDGGHNPPATFLHFEMLGGRYVAEALSLHGLSGTVPLQRLIGRRTIAGHHGLLYFGLPYQHGGGEFGSHYTFTGTKADGGTQPASTPGNLTLPRSASSQPSSPASPQSTRRSRSSRARKSITCGRPVRSESVPPLFGIAARHRGSLTTIAAAHV
jgi:hypothetical protein